MTMEYITSTGERWRKRGGIIEVGLSSAMQDALGAARHIQLPAIGTLARAGKHIGVVEGALSAAEFYAPCDGKVIWIAKPEASISDWLVGIAPDANGEKIDKDCQDVG